jgi:ketosteroid isomerase-like protein
MSDTQAADNKEIARRFFAALNRADSAAIAALYADDAVLWTAGTLPFSGTFTKAQAIQAMDAILSFFPEGLRFTITAMTAEGERVAIEAESHGRHVSGKIYHNQYHFLMIIRDGKVGEFREYMDTMHANDVLVGAG